MILFVTILIGFSCRKDREVAKYAGEYTITGKVRDEITGNGIPHANVGVIERNRDATSHLGGKTVAFDKSDAEGNFTLKFSANSEKNNYELTANALAYFEISGGGDLITFTKNGSRAQNIVLSPKGYLNYIIKGNQGENNIVYLNYENGGGPFYKNTDTILSTYKTPLQNVRVGYNVYDVNMVLVDKIIDTVFIDLGDTTYYLIEF